MVPPTPSYSFPGESCCPRILSQMDICPQGGGLNLLPLLFTHQRPQQADVSSEWAGQGVLEPPAQGTQLRRTCGGLATGTPQEQAPTDSWGPG